MSYEETLTYDASGNVISIDNSSSSQVDVSFDWEGRQLIEYTSDCNEISYRYNDQGSRTQKVVTTCDDATTIDYMLDGDHVLVETHSNGITLAYTYDVDGSLLSMNYNGTDYFYVTNLQGDVIELLDSQGTRVVSYEYDAWGNILHQTGGVLAELNPYRYRGYRYDSETDYYYLQSRYYDPSIGRFISSDGLVGEVGNLLSHNMYAYGANNPVMNVDPSGESTIALTLGAAAAIGPIGWVAVLVVVVAIVLLASNEITDSVEKLADSVMSEYEKTLKKDYTVYSLVDEQGIVRYIGRVKTANYKARMEYHRLTKPGLDEGPKIDNLNYWECRGIEQLGIMANASGWFDLTSNPSGNKINGIGHLNPFRMDYYSAGFRYIANNLENEWTNLFH